jgi:hypothetical protein
MSNSLLVKATWIQAPRNHLDADTRQVAGHDVRDLDRRQVLRPEHEPKLEARAVGLLGEAGRVEQLVGLGRIERVVDQVLVVERRSRRDRPHHGLGQPREYVAADEGSVDRMRDRLAHAAVAERRVTHVDVGLVA